MSSRLFLLLTESSQSQICLTKLESAYEEFAVTLLEKLQKETNITQLYYNLSFVRLELAEIRDFPSNEKGKKCLEFCC